MTKVSGKADPPSHLDASSFSYKVPKRCFSKSVQPYKIATCNIGPMVDHAISRERAIFKGQLASSSDGAHLPMPAPVLWILLLIASNISLRHIVRIRPSMAFPGRAILWDVDFITKRSARSLFHLLGSHLSPLRTLTEILILPTPNGLALPGT